MAKKWMQKASKSMKRRGTIGSFTAAANRAGMGVQEYARKILASGSQASPAMKKRAAFAKAAGSVARKRKKKKSYGGSLGKKIRRGKLC